MLDLEEHLPPEQRQGQFRVVALCESDMDIEIGGDEYNALLEKLKQSAGA